MGYFHVGGGTDRPTRENANDVPPPASAPTKAHRMVLSALTRALMRPPFPAPAAARSLCAFATTTSFTSMPSSSVPVVSTVAYPSAPDASAGTVICKNAVAQSTSTSVSVAPPERSIAGEAWCHDQADKPPCSETVAPMTSVTFTMNEFFSVSEPHVKVPLPTEESSQKNSPPALLKLPLNVLSRSSNPPPPEKPPMNSQLTHTTVPVAVTESHDTNDMLTSSSPNESVPTCTFSERLPHPISDTLMGVS